jgi:hypothetical protein
MRKIAGRTKIYSFGTRLAEWQSGEKYGFGGFSALSVRQMCARFQIGSSVADRYLLGVAES